MREGGDYWTLPRAGMATNPTSPLNSPTLGRSFAISSGSGSSGFGLGAMLGMDMTRSGLDVVGTGLDMDMGMNTKAERRRSGSGIVTASVVPMLEDVLEVEPVEELAAEREVAASAGATIEEVSDTHPPPSRANI